MQATFGFCIVFTAPLLSHLSVLVRNSAESLKPSIDFDPLALYMTLYVPSPTMGSLYAIDKILHRPANLGFYLLAGKNSTTPVHP